MLFCAPTLLYICASMENETIKLDIETEGRQPNGMVLRTEELVKKYRQRTVVNHVSINVTQGEIVGLLGPNGAGKTTTFYMTTGLVPPNEGRIFLNDLLSLQDMHNRIIPFSMTLILPHSLSTSGLSMVLATWRKSRRYFAKCRWRIIYALYCK